MHTPENTGNLSNREVVATTSNVYVAKAPETATAYLSETRVDDAPGGLLAYLHILRRHKGAILLIGFLGAILGFLATLPQPPVYKARASLEVQDMNQDFLNMKQASPEVQNYSALSDIQTQIRILLSDSLKERTLAKMKLSDQAPLKQQQSRLSAWRHALNLPEPAPTDRPSEAIRSISQGLKVRAAGQTRIIEILVDSTDPAFAASFANTLANEYIEQNMEARWTMSQRTGDWLTRQLDEMRVTLERSEDALQAYARTAGLVFTGGGSSDKDVRQSVSEAKLNQIQQALSVVSADRVAKQSRYQTAASSSPDTLPDVLNDSNLREYQSKLTELRRQLAELSTTYTPDYPRVKRLQAQAQTLDAALERERNTIVKRIKNDYDEAVRREALLASDYAKQSQVVTQEAERGIQYGILKREVETNRQLYDTMLQRVKESTVVAAMKASNVRVIDAAAVPTVPYKPNFAQNTVLGLLAGSFFGVVVVLIRESADRTLQAPGDAPFWLTVPELAVIPSKYVGLRRYYRAKTKHDVPETSLLTGATASLPDRIELVTIQRRSSMVAEAFRTLLTSLLFSGDNGTRPKVVVLTSSLPGEGKSTVTSNLGVTLAEIGRKVLLIDADLRKPRLHSIFGIGNERGLGDILKTPDIDTSKLDEWLEGTIVPGLWVLTSGPPTTAAANLLFARHLPRILEALKREFDMILIDTPPLLQMADARVLGRHADAVLLVTRAGVTSRTAALAAKQRLSEDTIPVIGTVLNDWNPKNSPTGYYGSYSGYRYGGYKGYYASGTVGADQ